MGTLLIPMKQNGIDFAHANIIQLVLIPVETTKTP